jgi:hypothetical protein
LYTTPIYCRALEHGGFVDERLTFRFADPQGGRWDFDLRREAEQETLSGKRLPVPDEGADPPPEGEGSLAFEFASDDADKSCDWLAELRLPLFYDPGVGASRDPSADDKSRVLRAAVVWLGVAADGAGCQVTGPRSKPLAENAGTLLLDRKPGDCLLYRKSNSVNLAWGVFVLFEDVDNDGAWDRDPLPGGTAEPLVGVAPQSAVVYLDGMLPDEELGDGHPLEGFSAQGLSRVRIDSTDETTGSVLSLSRLDNGNVENIILKYKEIPEVRTPRLPAP